MALNMITASDSEERREKKTLPVIDVTPGPLRSLAFNEKLWQPHIQAPAWLGTWIQGAGDPLVADFNRGPRQSPTLPAE